jgi:hypothetical protein
MTLAEYRDWLERQIAELGPRLEALINARKVLLEAQSRIDRQAQGRAQAQAQARRGSKSHKAKDPSTRQKLLKHMKEHGITRPEFAKTSAELAERSDEWSAKQVANALWYSGQQGLVAKTEDAKWYLRTVTETEEKRETTNAAAEA